jgi:hypothetical protein
MNKMINRLSALIVRPGWIAAVAFLVPGAALAFPPTPDHQFYGLVRDPMGDPLMVKNAEVILETTNSIKITTMVVPNLDVGVNYRLSIPMDAGLTPDNYKPTALRPTVSFRMKVMIGAATWLPLELKGSYANLGKPAQTTHLDLTLGADSDGDGLPDAWEQMLIDVLGDGRTLADIKPEDDADGDGLSNLQEYLAGTYAFDSEDGLRLDIVGTREGRPLLDFMAIRGRTYTILSSTNMTTWEPVNFRMADENNGAAPMSRYSATDVRIVHAEAITAPKVMFFKLKAQ